MSQNASPPIFSLKWGAAGGGPGQFNDPEGVAVGPDGRVYVVDTENHRVQVFDSNGKFLFAWGSLCELSSGKGCQNPDGNGQFKEPEGIIAAPDGTIYVADSGNDRIELFEADGRFRARWGNSGAGEGQLSNPVGLALDKQGDLFVADTLNQRLEVFNAAGVFVRAWGSKGSADGQFKFPSGVAVDPDSGVVYVTDNGNHRVERFDLFGAFIGVWGSLCALVGDEQTPAGTGCQSPQGEGQFKLPFGIALDKPGNVYVVDQGNRRIQIFDPVGHFLFQWGSSCDLGSGAGCVDPDGPGPLERGDGQFLSPKGIAIASDGTIYIADSDNNRVQVFRSSR
jgi:DNA-binding beta-propeller fold protein YncE